MVLYKYYDPCDSKCLSVSLSYRFRDNNFYKKCSNVAKAYISVNPLCLHSNRPKIYYKSNIHKDIIVFI